MRYKRDSTSEYVATKVTPEVKRELEKIAREERRTLSQVARIAIEKFLESRSVETAA